MSSSNPTDLTANLAELISKVGVDQDKQAFASLFNHYAPLIKAFAYKMGGPANLDSFGDDLTQEVMIKVWRKAANFDPKLANANTWLYTIARNTRIDILRKHNVIEGKMSSEEIFEDAMEFSPVDDLQQKRDRKHVHMTISKLPIDQKNVLSKSYLEGLTHQEISDQLELPLGTVKSRLRLALNRMQILIDRHQV